MELIGLATLFANAVDAPLSDQLLARLGKGAVFLEALLDTSGRAPAIGDDDEGRVLTCPGIDEIYYVASVARSIGALTGLRFAHDPQAGYMREALFAHFGNVACDPSERTPVSHFPDGGYTIVERTINGHAAHLTFDHGSLGFGSLAAHGHADALSLWLSLDGRPVFIDAGTWLYHSGEMTRNKLRSSAVHNTLTIAGQSQSVPSSAFSWSSKAVATACSNLEGETDVISGEHDGYVKRFGVRHRREIVIRDNAIRVSDMLAGRAGASDLEISFLCAPDVFVEELEGALVLRRCNSAGDEPFVVMKVPADFTASVICGRDSEARGVYSPRFGELEETSHIILRGRLSHCLDGAQDASRASATTVISILKSRAALERVA